MKFLFRTDASDSRGTGHIMRCLTLASELAMRGHEVALLTGPIGMGWLGTVIRDSGVVVYSCELDALPLDRVRDIAPDWLIVDSYDIPPELVSAAALHVPVLAIVDGDDRGISASLYLDQNLGAETIDRPAAIGQRFLAGAEFALVRRAVIDAAKPEPWVISSSRPRVLCFMGGTDAMGTVIAVTVALAALKQSLDLTVIAGAEQHASIRAAMAGPATLRLLLPTPDFPSLLASADIVVSAAGTSAWDICTLGIPAVFVGVIDNQSASLREVVSRGLALGVDTTERGSGGFQRVGEDVRALIEDDDLRRTLSLRSRSTFDGRGASRVAERLESEGTRPLLEW